MSEEAVVARQELLEQLVGAHREVFDGLLEATADLDEAGWSAPTGCPGWDVHDQLAHCVGLERLMLGDPSPQVEVPDLPHLRDDVQRYLERDVQARRGVPGDELRQEARETFSRRVAALEALTPQDLEGELDSPLGRMRAPKVLRTRVFDLVAHEQDIRRALGRDVPMSGARADVAVEQVLRAWVAALPRRLETVGVIGVEVADRGPTTLDLRAGELRHEPPTDPDARVRLTAGQVVALGCGRSDAPTLDEAEPAGDHALLRAFFEAASVTP